MGIRWPVFMDMAMAVRTGEDLSQLSGALEGGLDNFEGIDNAEAAAGAMSGELTGPQTGKGKGGKGAGGKGAGGKGGGKGGSKRGRGNGVAQEEQAGRVTSHAFIGLCIWIAEHEHV